MLQFLNLQPEIFGLDINDSSIKVAKLKEKRGIFYLVSLNEVFMKPGIIKEGVILDMKALVRHIKSVCNSVKGEQLNTKHVAMSLPEERSFSQVIQMPKMTEVELKTAVPFEAENYIPLPIENVYLDFQRIEAHSEELDVNHLDLLINVMPKNIVDSYITSAKDAGLVPCIMEVESQAIVTALIKDKKNLPPTIFIDLGQDNTSFIIFSGGSIRFTSSLSVYSAQFTQAISEKLSITSSEAEKLKIKCGLVPGEEKKYDVKQCLDPVLYNLVNEIKKYINFYKGHVGHEYFYSDKKIEKIILSGGGAYLKGLPKFLNEQLLVPVEFGNPFINVQIPKNSNVRINSEKALSFTTAIGLALRGAKNQI